ncbi:MAG: hypothetical protein COV99_10260 [Bacteroidetes bacterium CG12_big_fil_rev_8_21_14_0_65_60_17]|nr:MAG: hypothetical protein COV99_10260 [Bacteroidetes bacterium CG12_big_fil_rev_8_21_14_0_65_60_17]
MEPTLFTGLTLLRPPVESVAERVRNMIETGLPLRAGALAGVVSRDLFTAAGLLKRANNSYYGLRNTVGSLTQAIEVLEPASVARMIVSTRTHVREAEVVHAIRNEAYATARVAHRLAKGTWPDAADSPPGTAFSAGLLFHYGTLVLAQSFPSQFAAMADSSPQTILFDSHDWRTPQQLLFGFDASETGAFAGLRFALPSYVVDVMSLGGHPVAHPSTITPFLQLLVSVASNLVIEAGYAATTSGSRDMESAEAARPLLGDELMRTVDTVAAELLHAPLPSFDSITTQRVS